MYVIRMIRVSVLEFDSQLINGICSNNEIPCLARNNTKELLSINDIIILVRVLSELEKSIALMSAMK